MLDENFINGHTDPPEEPPQVDEGFHIDGAESANWVVRKILAARKYKMRVEEWAAAETKRAAREEEFFLHRFAGELEAWTRQEIEINGGKRRSVNLPAGVVGFRKTQPGLDIIDEKMVIDWCSKLLPAALVLRASIRSTVIAQHIEKTGEIPDGTAVREGGDRLYIR